MTTKPEDFRKAAQFLAVVSRNLNKWRWFEKLFLRFLARQLRKQAELEDEMIEAVMRSYEEVFLGRR